ncbi:hypothetical protein CHS0354_002368 [Potamilus streckersoni]|uniref:UDENN FNIP1/2-type domain-containing protein n=1 Tax=Potamilus streckersoni TaxID=2493646 RepID=A0AAE0SN80_9BIVA|nr:hypothetical protein CHS0354_002368 [Potamilus streckersoni]
MAYFQKLLNKTKFTKSSSSKLSPGDIKTEWKQPTFKPSYIRLILFADNDIRGRQLIFDSQSLRRAQEKEGHLRCQRQILAQKLAASKSAVKAPDCPAPNYELRPGSDVKMLEEMMFGAEGFAYRARSVKVHVTRSPPQVILTKVFVPEKPKRTSVSDLDNDSCSFSSQSDLTLPKPISQEKDSPIAAQSIPVDVPSPRQGSLRNSIDIIDEDSGLASLTSSGSFQAPFSSPGSNTSSYNSLHRRWQRVLSTSLESVCKRRSHQDLLSSQDTTSPARPKRCKIAIGVILDTVDESSGKDNGSFETFFFSHITLFESHLERLRIEIERGLYNKKNFHNIVIAAFESFRQNIFDLYTAPRLSEPVWLNMMSFSNYRYILCEKFLNEFMSLVKNYDNKNTQFFISTVVTAVLTHHLAWVPTVTPAGGTPSNTYLDKHSAKWVDTLAKTHPYNPLWAQLGDLYGAIGFPLRLSRTVVVGKKAELVKKIIYVLSYFIRCSDILETSETGHLDSVLERLTFVESPGDVEKDIMQKSNDIDIGKIEEDCNSNRYAVPQLGSVSCLNCSLCNTRQEASVIKNHYGKSVFYDLEVKNVCFCIGQRPQGDIQLQEENHETGNVGYFSSLGENVPVGNSKEIFESQECHSVDEGFAVTLKECRLSEARIVEESKIQDVQLVQRADTSPSGQFQTLGKKTVDLKLDLKACTTSIIPSESFINTQTSSSSYYEIKKVFLEARSNSIFNEYFDEGIETKTIDDLDENDRIPHLLPTNKHRFLSGDHGSSSETEDMGKAPSLPDLSQVKMDAQNTKQKENIRTSHRERLDSLDQKFRGRKPSFTRQVSEQSASRPSGFAPGRCRPVTPTELGRRRHLSSSSSFDLDFLDPSAFCRVLPMPEVRGMEYCSSQKSFEKNFGRSLLAEFSDHYMSDFVLHGTSDKNYQEKLQGDLKMAIQHSVLDEPIAEAVCIIADTDLWSVNLYSSRHELSGKGQQPQKCVASPIVSNLIESVLQLWKLKMSPEFCIMHLEDRLQEIYFKSKMLAEYLKGTKNCTMMELTAMFGFERSDLPLLVAIAGTHSPHLSLCSV